MEDMIMNNEIIEEETKCEVVTNDDNRDYEDQAYYPVTTETESVPTGPNKALIALAIGGGLLVAKPAIKKAKAAIEKHKEKKAKKEHDHIMKVLEETGLVVPKTVEVKATEAEVKDEIVAQENIPEETKEEVKETK